MKWIKKLLPPDWLFMYLKRQLTHIYLNFSDKSVTINTVSDIYPLSGGANLKIEINIDEKADGLTVCVRCPKLTPEIEKIIETLRMLNDQLSVKKDGEIFLLDVARVLYIESVDRKCFVYTSEEIYETDMRLYELERDLEHCGFFRVSKSCLVNLRTVRSLRADIDRRIRITMSNGEQIIASRQYADGLKERLGVKS